jgi:hypothetical protein
LTIIPLITTLSQWSARTDSPVYSWLTKTSTWLEVTVTLRDTFQKMMTWSTTPSIDNNQHIFNNGEQKYKN